MTITKSTSISRADPYRRFRQHRPGRLPLILRHIGIAPDRITIVTAARTRFRRRPQELRRQVHQGGADARELPPHPQPAARARRLPDQRLGRGLQHRADQAVLGEGRDVSRHLHRAVARRLHRPDGAAGDAAPTTRCARKRWRCVPAMLERRPPCSRTAQIPAWCRISSSRRCSTSPPTRRVDAGNPTLARATGAIWRGGSASR